ncbi:hypothetical protein PC116_g9833 [Phytophthora cactorum]|nr:hypothetical protein Pcac1_g3438 [Phytophthora cactorum]KAG3128258.1 hypothetical protein C6341_g24639 [Phytophthora cactorum]KAG4242257.1 hypothetical protein PC116_g9833 [Phytophthora cactorum]
MHLEATLATTSSITTVSRYLYEMERGIKATDVHLGSCITIRVGISPEGALASD